MAFPHSVLENRGMGKSVEVVVELCKKEGVGKIVLGESKNYKGEDNIISSLIREFKIQLEKRGQEVDFESETLTSAEAERIQGKNEMLDASAAAIILSAYLARKKE